MVIPIHRLPENLREILKVIIKTNMFRVKNLENSKPLIPFNRNAHFQPKLYKILTNITKFLMQPIKIIVYQNYYQYTSNFIYVRGKWKSFNWYTLTWEALKWVRDLSDLGLWATATVRFPTSLNRFCYQIFVFKIL